MNSDTSENNTNSRISASPRARMQSIMERVQTLSQTGEIDGKIRKEIAKLSSEALVSGDFSELNKIFRRLRYAAFNGNTIDELIELTEQ